MGRRGGDRRVSRTRFSSDGRDPLNWEDRVLSRLSTNKERYREKKKRKREKERKSEHAAVAVQSYGTDRSFQRPIPIGRRGIFIRHPDFGYRKPQ